MYRSAQVVAELALVLSSAMILHDQIVGCLASEGQVNWTPSEDSWNYWWSYSGVSGPAYWGLLNLDWFMCDKGRRQSPIDIETRSLVYDLHLKPLRADNNLISGILYNDGHAIVFSGSPSRFLMANQNKLVLSEQQQQDNKQKQSNGSVASKKRRRLNEAALIVSQPIEELQAVGTIDQPSSLAQETKQLDSSASILRDLSNSVEFSISQNERIDQVDQDKANLYDDSLANGDSASFDLATGAGDEFPLANVHFNGAGLIYPYKFEALYMRFGQDSKAVGSEHLIDSRTYAAELQLFSYNSVLYKSFLEASSKPHGLLGISILIDVLPAAKNYSSQSTTTNEKSSSSSGANSRAVNIALNEQLESLVGKLSEVKHRGSWTMVNAFNLSALLPETDYFVSYDGSLTMPGCHESVNWLVLNKPLYITQSNLDSLRFISADEQSSDPTGTLIAGNIRPVQPANNRPIRTNIRPSGGNEAQAIDNSFTITNRTVLLPIYFLNPELGGMPKDLDQIRVQTDRREINWIIQVSDQVSLTPIAWRFM